MEEKLRYKKLFSIFKNIKGKQIFLLFICSLSILFDNFVLLQIQKLVDAIVSAQPLDSINRLVLIMFLFGGISFAFNTYQMKVWHTFTKYLENQMRKIMVSNFFNKNIDYINGQSKGDLTSKLLNDGTAIATHIGLNPIMIIINIFRILIILFILSTFSIQLVMVIVILMPIYVLLTILINGKMREYSRKEREAFGRLYGRLAEMISGFKEIKIFDKESYFGKLFENILYSDYFSSIKKVIKIQVTNTALSSYIKIIFPIIILWRGAYLSLQGNITVGMLVAFYTYITHLIEPMNNLGDIYQGTKQAYGAVDRVYDFLFNSEQKKQDPLIDIKKIETIGININKFSINNVDILNDIDIRISDNDRIFIAGESGSGKSTIVNLLIKVFTDFVGEIKINEINYLTISTKSYYQKMIVVFQEPLLFEGSVRDNLTLGDNYSNAEIEEALYVVNLNEFIKDKSIDFIVKEGATNISGGQKQRLAIARAILRKPNVLILDEATNGLDAKTEKILVERLDYYLRINNIKLICISHNNIIKSICNKELFLER